MREEEEEEEGGRGGEEGGFVFVKGTSRVRRGGDKVFRHARSTRENLEFCFHSRPKEVALCSVCVCLFLFCY